MRQGDYDELVARVLAEQAPVPRQLPTIARLAGVSRTRAREVLERLERLGLAERDAHGCYVARRREASS